MSTRAACACGGRLIGYPEWLRDERGRPVYQRNGMHAFTSRTVWKHVSGGCDHPQPMSVYHLNHPDPVGRFLEGGHRAERVRLEGEAACGTRHGGNGRSMEVAYAGVASADRSAACCIRCLQVYAKAAGEPSVGQPKDGAR